MIWKSVSTKWSHFGEIVLTQERSLFTGISNLIKLQIENDPFISINNIPVTIFEYDLENVLTNELNKLGVCVVINFCELTDQIKAFQENTNYTFQGKIDVYEAPEINRGKSDYVTGYDTAQEVLGSLQSFDLISNNLTQLDIISLKNTNPAKKAADEEAPDLIRWTLIYQLKPMITSQVY